MVPAHLIELGQQALSEFVGSDRVAKCADWIETLARRRLSSRWERYLDTTHEVAITSLIQ